MNIDQQAPIPTLIKLDENTSVDPRYVANIGYCLVKSSKPGEEDLHHLYIDLMVGKDRVPLTGRFNSEDRAKEVKRRIEEVRHRIYAENNVLKRWMDLARASMKSFTPEQLASDEFSGFRLLEEQFKIWER